MNVIFLDVDGVLNNNYTSNKIDGYVFVDDELVSNLKDIVDKTGAKIVLSSDWRFGDDSLIKNRPYKSYISDEIGKKMYTSLISKLNDFGLVIIDITPYLPGFKRGKEISTWLHDNQDLLIDNYVIIDDRTDFLPDQIKNHFVHTDYWNGLSEDKVSEAIGVLM